MEATCQVRSVWEALGTGRYVQVGWLGELEKTDKDDVRFCDLALERKPRQLRGSWEQISEGSLESLCKWLGIKWIFPASGHT